MGIKKIALSFAGIVAAASVLYLIKPKLSVPVELRVKSVATIQPSAQGGRGPASVPSNIADVKPQNLFSEVENGRSAEEISQLANIPVVRAREIQLNEQQLKMLEPGQKTQMTMDLFDDVKVVANINVSESRAPKGIFIVGTIPKDTLGQVDLVYSEGHFIGHVFAKGLSYRLMRSDRNTHYIIEVDVSKLPKSIDEGAYHPQSSNSNWTQTAKVAASAPSSSPNIIESASSGQVKALAAEDRTVRVLFLYTSAAMTKSGGTQAVQAEIANEVNIGNQAFVSSGINGALEIAGFLPTSYVEHTDMMTDINNLQSGAGALSGVREAMKNHNADIVMLYVDRIDAKACGLAPVGSPVTYPSVSYGVAARACDVFAIAHEIGHILGADHDSANAKTSQVPYARGYINTNAKYRTVMAYECLPSRCGLVKYFSNQVTTFNGQPLGNANADNARRINEVLPYTAGFAEFINPALPIQPEPFVEASLGRSITLSCARPTISNPSFQWYFNGKIFAGLTASRMTIDNVQAANAGLYQCYVYNESGGTFSNPTQLLIQGVPYKPIITTDLPERPSVQRGQNVNYAVIVKADPAPTYQWFRKEGGNWVPLQGLTSNLMSFSGFDWQYRGTYKVVVTNSAGSTESKPMDLNLNAVTRGGQISTGAGVYELERTGGFQPVENMGAARAAQ